MKKPLFFTLTALIFCFCTVNAQIVPDYLKKKQKEILKSATKKADEKVDEEIDKQVQKGVDKLFNKLSKEIETATDSINEAKDSTKATELNAGSQNSEERLNAAMGNYMKALGVGVDVPHKDAYRFNSAMNILIEHTKSDGSVDDPVFYNMYFSSDGSDYGMIFKDESSNNSTFVFDSENNCTLILMDDGEQKTGIATRISEERLKDYEEVAGDYVEEEIKKPEDYNLKKTGKTKVISGYKCDEYMAEDEEAVLTLWVTNDLKGKVNKKLFKNQYFGGSIWMTEIGDGVVIQSIDKSKQTKEVSTMTVKELDFNTNKSITTNGYTITGISM